MSDQPIADQVKQILVDEMCVDADSVNPEATLEVDLLMDDIDRVEFAMALEDHFQVLIPDDAEAQWVAVGDDVVEMGLWFGRAKRDDIARSALILTSTGHHELVAPADAPDAPVGELSRFVYEPNGAVIRAHLIGDVARSLGGHMIDESIAFITTA